MSERTAHARGHRRRARTDAAPASARAIVLHVERLVLHGFAPAEAGTVAHAIERELAELARQPGFSFRAVEIDRLPSAQFAGGSPEQTGRAAAGAVWSGFAAAGQGEPR